MSQQIRVVQCIQCKMYQVDIVKKANKWECKLCRQKQNLLKELFRGSGPECRAKVQQLNLERGMQEEKLEEKLLDKAMQQMEDDENLSEEPENIPIPTKVNKWASYVDGPIECNRKPTGAPEVKDLDEEISMNFNKSERKLSRPAKRPAESNPSVNKKINSKWSDFL
ncbi:MRN complex-interacting protein [Drosophila ficusphila]|uniref:MRN complex-interacting protein n=1 Tax=Drosophila ficusphila TaxID=30025 RepID=UPI0007E838AD|nr:MRN complex-interacting protein [Drosophila ficusphila]